MHKVTRDHYLDGEFQKRQWVNKKLNGRENVALIIIKRILSLAS